MNPVEIITETTAATKTTSTPPESVSDSVHTLLQHSQDGLEKLNETDQHLQTCYAQLAQETLPLDTAARKRHEAIREEIAALKTAAGNYKKCYNTISAMTDELQTRLHDTERSQKKGLVPKAPANATIDFAEQKSGHFAQGLNFYKLFLIFFAGSFAGVMVELLWCLMRNGYLESRAGLVYGPFNLLYGAGAVALTLALYRFRNRNSSISFLGGLIVGSVVEYVCSWGQETVFGSCSWDYSSMPFNINGRICLLYSVFWGLLGVLWMKNLYPRIAKWILRIPNHTGKIITWILFAFLLFDAIMTIGAVFRWSQRIDGIAATNGLQTFFDVHFPNARMERIFANMKFQ